MNERRFRRSGGANAIPTRSHHRGGGHRTHCRRTSRRWASSQGLSVDSQVVNSQVVDTRHHRRGKAGHQALRHRPTGSRFRRRATDGDRPSRADDGRADVRGSPYHASERSVSHRRCHGQLANAVCVDAPASVAVDQQPIRLEHRRRRHRRVANIGHRLAATYSHISFIAMDRRNVMVDTDIGSETSELDHRTRGGGARSDRRRRGLQYFSVVWAGVGLGASLATLRQVNADARLLVVALVVLCPLAAAGAAFLLGRRNIRSAGLVCSSRSLCHPSPCTQ